MPNARPPKKPVEIAGFGGAANSSTNPPPPPWWFDVGTEDTENVLVYDLGGGTFDVSIVEITGDVTEVLASHGQQPPRGDDFDRQLQRHLADKFLQTHGGRSTPPTRPPRPGCCWPPNRPKSGPQRKRAFTTVAGTLPGE